MKTFTISACLVLALALFAGSADAQTYKITNTLTTGTVGTPVLGALVTANGFVPTLGTTYAVTAGNLPAGVTLSAQGVFGGTPTKAEVAKFTVTATVPAMTIPPQTAGTATLAITITISAGASPLTIETKTLPDGRLGESYSAAIVVKGGTSPYGYVTDPRSLPTGVTLDPTKGTLSGRATAAGTFTFTVYVTDTTLPLPKTANRQFTVNITAGPQLEATGSTEWTVDRNGFRLVVAATGGDGTYTFGTPTGVPAGLTPAVLTDQVTLTGTPTRVGESRFSVSVTDGKGAKATLVTTIKINPPVELVADDLPGATVGAAYGGVVAAEDGAPPYSFRIVDKTESWIGIDSATGNLTGTATATGPTDHLPGTSWAGSVTLTVEVTDASGDTDRREFTVNVNNAPVLYDLGLPFGITGQPYSGRLFVSGGTGPLLFTVEAGELVRGLALTDGVIEGTPTRPGFSDLTIAVTDIWGVKATADFALTVGELHPASGKLPTSTLPAESRQAFVFDLLAGTTFDLALKAKPGTSGFYATLWTFDGHSIKTASYETLRRKSLKIRKFPVKKSGRFVLLLENANASTAIDWSGKVKSKPTKKLKHLQSFGPFSDEVEIPFSALRGAVLTLSASVSRKNTPSADLVEILSADDVPLDVRAFFKTTKSGFKLSKLPIPASGDYRIRVRSDGTGSEIGTLKVRAKIKSPKIYDYSVDD